MEHDSSRTVGQLVPTNLLLGVALFVQTACTASTEVPGASPGDGLVPEAGLSGNPAAPDASQAEELIGPTWRLDSYSDGTFLKPVLAQTAVTAMFGADGTLNGDASCNSYTGMYRAGENAIAIGPLSTTRMACEPPVMQQEQAYLAALGAATSFQVQGQTLTLAEAGGTPIAIFGKVGQPGTAMTSTPDAFALASGAAVGVEAVSPRG